MGWKLVSRNKTAHHCSLPTPKEMQLGDVILCDCGQFWKHTLWPGDFRNPAEYGWKPCDSKGKES